MSTSKPNRDFWDQLEIYIDARKLKPLEFTKKYGTAREYYYQVRKSSYIWCTLQVSPEVLIKLINEAGHDPIKVEMLILNILKAYVESSDF